MQFNRNNKVEHFLSQSKLCKIMQVIAVINFLSFILFVGYLGGDAVSGYHESGRYFVRYRHEVTEVSRLLWNLNHIQCFSIFITHLAAMCCPIFSKSKNIFYKKLY